MTPDILEYLLRLTVIWAVLAAYYFLALRRAGFAAQRFYLLGTLVFGLVVPLLPALGGGLPVVGLPSVTYVAEPYFYTGYAVAETTGFNWSWSVVLPWLYGLGVVFFAARTLVQWRGLWSWASSGEQGRYDGYRVVRHRAITGPFVAFGVIFLPAAMPDAKLEHTALIHEASHLRARHHYDTLLLTIGSLLLWFHPLFWMLRRLLATVHEYEADAAVIQRVPVRTYGLQLLHATLGPAGFPGLFSSPIKKRITMITTKNRARKLRLLPLLTLCLLLAGLVVACSDLGEQAAIPLNNENPLSEIVLGPENTLTPDEYPKPVSAGNAAPTFETLIKSFYQEIRYPAAARAAGKTGFVRLEVSLSESGKILSINNIGLTKKEDEDQSNNLVVVGHSEATTQSFSPGVSVFTDELERLVNELAPFTPAKLDGKAVPFTISFDVEFKLEE